MNDPGARSTTDSISVVVPVFNSQNSLAPLVLRLSQLLPSVAERFEVILVNDGSRDSSWPVVVELAKKYPFVSGISLRRNYGQHNALLCGVRAATHEVIVTLDDDLQHPPEEIPKLLGRLAEGFDVVYGVARRPSHSWTRNLLSRLTKRVMAKAMGIPNIRDINAFRAFRTGLRQAFSDYRSPNLLLDVLLSWGTTRFATVEVKHEARKVGESNYTVLKLFNQTMLILTGFTTGPLRLASLTGFTFTFFGLVLLAYVIGRYLLEGSVPGFPFLASAIAVFSGAQLFALGIMGEYLARMFDRSIQRPTYVVGEIAGRARSVATMDDKGTGDLCYDFEET